LKTYFSGHLNIKPEDVNIEEHPPVAINYLAERSISDELDEETG